MSVISPVGAQPLAGRREWAGLAVLALPTLLISLDQSVLFLALPHLVESLRPTGTQSLWIMDAYGFLIAGFLITMGALGNRIGRRRLLLVGAVAVALTSLLAAYATSAELLIAARALLGVAAATLMPSTLSLINSMFHDPGQRGRAIAVWAGCFMAGTALGPVVGGLLLERFWWGSVFLLGVPVMLVLLVAGPRLLPEYKEPGGGRLDLVSVVLSLAAVLPVVHGLKELARHGWSTAPLLSLAGGLAVGAVFVARQRRIEHPLLDLGLLRGRGFAAALAILLVSMIATAGSYLFITGYLQLVAGLSPMEAGLWMVPSAIASIVAAQLAPTLARRFPVHLVVAGGLLVAALGYGLLVLVGPVGGMPLLVAGFVAAFFGGGPIGALGTALVVGSAPPERAGSAAALSSVCGDLGAALGVALLGSLGTAVYQGSVTVPDGVSPQLAEAVRSGADAALVAAQALPAGAAETAGRVLDAAREAYTNGLNAAGAVCAVIAVASAAIAATTLRKASD
ncbi:MFS transporter [Streptomyces sp. NRRL F-5727]|uniref:MFS transporter n=1 Tax=Streptomyces sp. NRRL F-5727 TaxID=1463871 RepID=UPI00068999AF|nr:MFS transporter [Streptomyces sp. NRRL F-5727]